MGIAWNDSLSIGETSVDHEHRHLISIINDIFNAVKEFAANRDMAKKLFSDLRSYTVVHFTHEEELMEAQGFPALEEHRQAHDMLKRQIKEYQDRLFEEGEVDAHSVLMFLKDWLVTHIISKDMRFKEYLASRRP